VPIEETSMKATIAAVAVLAALTFPAFAQQAESPLAEPKSTANASTSPMKGTIAEYDGRSAFALKTAEGKMVKGTISGSRSKVMIKGAPGSREALKVGMNCTVTGPADGEASEIVCD
jgi:hypothetical protein